MKQVMEMEKIKLILASNSRWRREIIEMAGLACEQVASSGDSNISFLETFKAKIFSTGSLYNLDNFYLSLFPLPSHLHKK